MGVRPNRLAPAISLPLTPDPNTFREPRNAVGRTTGNSRITVDDFRGLSPVEVNNAMNVQIRQDALAV